MRVLVFERNLNGHRLEYLHHLHGVAASMPDDNFIFALPHTFNDSKKLFEWPSLPNVVYDLSLEPEETTGENIGIRGLLQNSYTMSKTLATYARKHNTNQVFVITIIDYIPFIALFMPKGVKLTGVLYKITTKNRKASFGKNLLNSIKNQVFVHSAVVNKVLVLNDKSSTQVLNKLYNTDKFTFIPDPFTPIPSNNLIDIRKEYNIPSDKTLFVHFGGLQKRKGTLDIVNSIDLLSQEELDNFVFFFAGKLYKDIEENFHTKTEQLKKKAIVYSKEEFCSYEFLASLCTAADAIVIPYHTTTQSSGLIGYASQFHTPVIAPSDGLLGQLIRDFKLGIQLDDISSSSLIEAYRKIRKREFIIPSDNYCMENNVSQFVNVIINSLR